ncbi:hypothetical protein PTSG_05818 [Salpingoeca rosetta]|uniref:PDZ and LIM domain protein Zasp n=1 Tax=Salpingoeca rosetta (strain ATCC 50818 / BSB-021) TaxID=946362 RepID=F2UCV9_SALR5|nr:uncharacterized protein PTSG_05818 [Salpingoeca rosetta]EGD74454.1 hypothetical protein PTSG_05818 [Salpingoeca rosetta]|eukprot:XP_004992711.1 hypothetical protein PTSG_05818 [Salpingoeca rosetta]
MSSTVFNVERRPGEKFGMAVQRFLVTSVTPGGPADRAGVKKGMRLSQINETNIQQLTHMQITGLIKASGNTMKLIVGTPEVAPAKVAATAPAPAAPAANTTPAPPAAKAAPATATTSAPPAPAQPAQPAAAAEEKKEETPQPPAPARAAPEPKKAAPAPTTTTSTTNGSSGANGSSSSAKTAAPAPSSGPSNPQKQRVPPSTTAEPKPLSTTQKMLVKDDKGNTLSVDAPLCTACSKPILTRYLEFDGGKYHRGCFVCKGCGANLANAGFAPSDSGLVCQKCWAKENGMVCAGCGEMIVPEMDKPVQYVTVNGKEYHKDCIKCKECGLVFKNGVPGPYLVGDDVLCKEHATARRRGGKTTTTTGGGGGISQDSQDNEKLNAIFKASRTGWK